jgi:hypothetical protein
MQLLRTLIAADFNDSRADFYFDGAHVELAIASRAIFFRHDFISTSRPRFGQP